jgi:hypothetical protein
MFNTPIIEVAIGLIFIFSLLAILVTQINTFFTNILKLRAKQLRDALERLILDDRLQAEILVHPLINLVKKPEQTASLEISPQMAEHVNSRKAELNNVTYIAPSTFVEALISTLLSRAGGDVYRPIVDAVESIPDNMARQQIVSHLQNLRLDPTASRLDALEAAIIQTPNNRALLEAFYPLKATLQAANYQNSELLPLLYGMAKIENPAFREALGIVLTTARSVDEARQKLENWFNDGMERASNLFARRMHFWSLAFAFVLALIFNVDTLYLGRSLWEDPELRQNVLIVARRTDERMVTQPVAPDARGVTVPEGVSTPEVGFETRAQSAEEVGEQTLDETLDQLQNDADDIGTTVQKILELQLPIGWEYVEITPDLIALNQELGLPDPRTNSRNLYNLQRGDLGLILQKILGILATTIAAAQGAPFWFDLLNRIARGGKTS